MSVTMHAPLQCGVSARRETLRFMRWGECGGIECYEREVVWVREIRARNVLRITRDGRVEDRPLGTYQPRGGALSAVEAAREIAHETARAYGCSREMGHVFPEGEILVVAEAWEVPHLADPRDGAAPIPPDWFLEEKAALDQWLLACSQDRQCEAPARRLEERRALALVVWRSRAAEGANARSLDAFRAAAEEEAPGEDGPRPGLA